MIRSTHRFSHRPRKRFGQHFLEPAWVDKLVDVIAPHADEAFIEIGAGRGALTAALARRVRRLVAVEIDRDLAAQLESTMPANVEVVNGDVLRLDLANVLERLATTGRRLRIAGNLPYGISTPILDRLITLVALPWSPEDATLLLQREVADRLAAEPGTRAYGALSILVRQHAEARVALRLPPGAFRPAPRVRSALVQLTFHEARVPVGSPARLQWLVRGLFSRRRKTILNALRPLAASTGASAERALDRAGVDPRRRPETLELEEFAALADALGP